MWLGGDDHDRLDAVGPGGLPRDHLMESAIGAGRVEAEIGA
jgi:hypothetical protein